MENITPFSRFVFQKIILVLSLVGLITAGCQPTARITPTPLVAITGGTTSAKVSQLTAEATSIYLPQITSQPSTVVSTEIGKGKIYYVATTGSDSNPGTSTSPFKTLTKGVSLLRTGDTLYIRGGKYILTSSLIVSASGDTIYGPITISTAPGETTQAVITGDTNGDGVAETPSSSVYSALVELRGSYLHLQNLKIAYSKGRGVKSGGKFNVISSNNINHIWESGIYVYGPDNIIERNLVWRTADLNYCNGAAGRLCNGNWPGGVAWGDAHDSVAPGKAPRIIIRNNKIYNTSGEGLLCMHTDNGLIEGNVVYDNWALNIDLDQCSYTTIQKNLVYATADKVWWKGTTRPSTGIMLSNEGIKDPSGNIYPIGHNRKVINNIVVGTGTNFYFWSGDGTGGGLPNSALMNDLIAYNTFVNTGGSGGTDIKIDAAPHSNTRIMDNIILETYYNTASIGSTSGLTFSHNLWSKTPPIAAHSSTDIIADPKLIDPNQALSAGGVLADWYKLTSTSPAIGKAVSLSEVTLDYWGNSRTSSPDLGADEVLP